MLRRQRQLITSTFHFDNVVEDALDQSLGDVAPFSFALPNCLYVVLEFWFRAARPQGDHGAILHREGHELRAGIYRQGALLVFRRAVKPEGEVSHARHLDPVDCLQVVATVPQLPENIFQHLLVQKFHVRILGDVEAVGFLELQQIISNGLAFLPQFDDHFRNDGRCADTVLVLDNVPAAVPNRLLVRENYIVALLPEFLAPVSHPLEASQRLLEQEPFLGRHRREELRTYCGG
mmetsp:Transcript_22/g.47  ORF Transcript_22/g.47 Transcript_22/m.47 type:complete len:234 (-) Transcript_22:484-1185(-)